MGKEQKSGFGIVGIIIIIAAVTVLGGGYFAYKNYSDNQACSKDLKICPDGSHVGRIPPMCEFSGCPASNQISEIDTSNWKTYRNNGFEIKYPLGWGYTLPCGEITFCIEFTHKGSPDTLTITSIRRDADILNHAFPTVFNGYKAFAIPTEFQFSEELCCERFIVKGQEVLLDVSIVSAEKFYFRKDAGDLFGQIPHGQLKQILSTFKFIPSTSSGQVK